MNSNGAIVTAKLMRTESITPWGFRLQGGLEFNQPLTVAKINAGSLSEQGGMQIGDILAKVNGQSIDGLRHKEAQDAIIAAGNYLELELERGPMNTWRPSVTPINDQPNGNLTRTSLAKNPQDSKTICSGHNTTAAPFNTKLVHLQYNSPANLYSEKNIEETLNAHAQVLSSGATGINFIKPDAPVNKASAVYLMVQEEEERKAKGLSQTPEPTHQNGYLNGHSDEKDHSPVQQSKHLTSNPASLVTKHVEAPSGVAPPLPESQQNRNICSDCERLIVGPFVRINNKSLHAECFRCNTCGSSLKNVGYFNINDKLYCDVHAKQLKSMLNDRGNFNPSPTPNPAPIPSSSAAANKINGFLNRTQQPSLSSVIPPPQLVPLSNVVYQGSTQSQMGSFQTQENTQKLNQFNQQTLPRQFKPVAAPTFNAASSGSQMIGSSNPNYNSMYGEIEPAGGSGVAGGNESSMNTCYSVKTHTETCTTAPKFNWPPGSVINPNTQSTTIQYRAQSTFGGSNRGSARPKSCYSTFTSSGSNYSIPNVDNSPQTTRTTNSLSVSPQRMMHGSAAMTRAGVPIAFKTSSQQPLINNNTRSAINTTQTSNLYESVPINITSSVPPPPPSNGCFGVTSGRAKTSAITDQNSGAKRGRGFLQNQLSGGSIPFCGYCSQPIRGQYIMAMNKTWCPNHFVCANTLCKRSLEDAGFVEEQGRLYCENCFETHFAPNCAKCQQRIKGECLNALDKQWHTACFTCTHCRRPFGNSSFYLEDALPYCEKDWNDLFTTKCAGCCLPIAAGDRWVEALSQNYHSNCFRCTVCKSTLEGQSFFAKQGKPFCRAHAR